MEVRARLDGGAGGEGPGGPAPEGEGAGPDHLQGGALRHLMRATAARCTNLIFTLAIAVFTGV